MSSWLTLSHEYSSRPAGPASRVWPKGCHSGEEAALQDGRVLNWETSGHQRGAELDVNPKQTADGRKWGLFYAGSHQQTEQAEMKVDMLGPL